jgi:4-amino-4-deoxy-L-arabinose transferase-like glycosyltransferase
MREAAPPAARRRGTPVVLGGLSLAVLAAGIFVRALSSDVFLDGTTYAAIARNLAEGRGSFWELVYVGPFRQHPPLAMWLESLAFRVAGDGPSVEYWWSVLLAGSTVVAMLALWDAVHAMAGRSARRVANAIRWWPILLLGVVPLFSWCVANNLLENVLTPLVLTSATLAVRSLAAESQRARVALSSCAGAVMFLAVLAKGPPALFVLATPACTLVLGPRARGRALATVGMIAGCLVVTGVTWAAFGPRLAAFAGAYVREQLLPSVRGMHEVAPSRLLLVRAVAQNAIPPVLVASGAVMRRLVERRGAFPPPARATYFFLALAATAVLPFLLLRKQMEWYAVPALPLGVMAIAAASRAGALEIVRVVERSRRVRWMMGALAAALCVAGFVAAGPLARTLDVEVAVALRDGWMAYRTGRTPDDRQSEYAWRHFRRDVLAQEVAIPPGARVGALAPYSFWRLLAYTQRHLRADVVSDRPEPYVIVEDAAGRGSLEGCELLQRQRPSRLFVYRCPR